ncbi:MAG: YitT family protein [Fusobacterium sp. JB021]|nr:YitT family protein [Fusobacterium sp. JB020]MDP0493761.1 YitT family protein [Fusobacterium sp. JB021]MDP0507245.1 YitT family protein [Fusobacterium sp. JB019]
MKKEIIKDVLLMTIGAFVYAFGINYFFVGNNFADGGVTGVSIILHYLFNFDIGLTYGIINIPLIIIGYKLIGGEFILKTLYGTIVTSVAFKVLSSYLGPMDDKFMAAVFGGILAGVGLGIMFASGGSSGGTDIIVKILNKFWDISVGKGFLAIDLIILSALGLLFGKEIFMYTLVGMFISTKVIDKIQDGFSKSKAITIISKNSFQIKDRIMQETQRGTTIIPVKGGYTYESKEMISCIVSIYDISTVKRIVRSLDNKAFMYITDVSEVLGEGFKELLN